MARMKTEGLDDIIQTFNQMADKGQAVQTAMLTSGAEEMTDAWMHAIEDAGHIKTGSMHDNVGYDGILGGDEKYTDIYPHGEDDRGQRNATKAFVLHYGWSKKAGSHFVDKAETAGEAPAVKAMEDIWGRFIETGEVPTVSGIHQQGKGTGKGISHKKG